MESLGIDKNSSLNAPIVLFVYNRPKHTKRTVEALQNNLLATSSDLIVYSDGAKNKNFFNDVQQVRAYIKTISGFKSLKIIERDKNLGLANSIVDGVTSVVNQYGSVIVLEDDLVTSSYFLQYMNDALSCYQAVNKVASIHGYVYPVDGLPDTFFIRGADCWGWATWADRWTMFESDGEKLLDGLRQRKLISKFDFNGANNSSQMLADQISGKNNSWAIRWHASTFLRDKYTLYPGKTLVLNIGNDGSGTHSIDTDVFNGRLCNERVRILNTEISESDQAFQAIENYFRAQQAGFLFRCKRKIRNFYRRIVC